MAPSSPPVIGKPKPVAPCDLTSLFARAQLAARWPIRTCVVSAAVDLSALHMEADYGSCTIVAAQDPKAGTVNEVSQL